MKIYRGPRTTDEWQETDSKSLEQIATSWTPEGVTRFDGTINKHGTRHTDIGVKLDLNDVSHLLNGLLSYTRRLEDQCTKKELKNAARLNGLRIISHLVAFHAHDAPSVEELLSAVEKIADHFSWSPTDAPPVISWIDLENV